MHGEYGAHRSEHLWSDNLVRLHMSHPKLKAADLHPTAASVVLHRKHWHCATGHSLGTTDQGQASCRALYNSPSVCLLGMIDVLLYSLGY